MAARFPFPKRSTRAFMAEARKTRGYSFFDWIHGYIYARFPFFYIGVGTGEHPLARKIAPAADRLIHLFAKLSPKGKNGKGEPESTRWTIADTYHGKVMPLESARELIRVQEDIRLPDLEKVIPFPRARDLIIQNPDHIVALDCPCRAAREHPCLPLDVCLIVGEPFASFVQEHHPQRSRWVTQDEAVRILEEEHQRGHVSHAFFKDAMLMRYFAICNCCECCCGAMQAQRNGVPMLISSGYVAKVSEDDCQGCGECEEACPFSAISVNGTSQVDYDACMGCGVCVSRCEWSAIELAAAPDKGVPLDIPTLMEQAIRAR